MRAGAAERGRPEIADAAVALQRRIDAGERSVVGVNRYAMEGEEEIATLQIDPSLEHRVIERLERVRARRDPSAVESALAALRAAAAGAENLMEALLAAARARASEGEIVGALQDVWGRYRETPSF